MDVKERAEEFKKALDASVAFYQLEEEDTYVLYQLVKGLGDLGSISPEFALIIQGELNCLGKLLSKIVERQGGMR